MALLHRVYEQKRTSADGDVIPGEYVHRWQRWTKAGLTSLGAIKQIHCPLKTPLSGGVDSYATIVKPLSLTLPSCHPENNKA
ncbi:MAG: hypothetical protein WCH04_05530 [Gammaproteobacteria bacterium]